MMIKKIKAKIKQGWEFVKRQWKKLLVILGIGVVLAAGNILTPDKIPFVMVNGERIEFAYTDDNSNENLIIRTDKSTYGGWNETNVYVMVENKSGIGQISNLQIFFSDESKSVADIAKLKTNVPYEIDVPDYQTVDYDCSTTTISTTTEKTEKKICQREEQIGTHKETRYRDEWQLQELSDFSQHENNLLIISKTIPEKDKKGFEAEKKIQIPILKNEVTYFKIKIEFPLKTKDEFFIETIGSEGGYGHLDPWYNSNWLYKKLITIDPSKVDAPLTNFPVMVKFSSSTFDFTHAKGDGTDFIFTDSGETTLIDFERERYASTTDGAVFWVEVPSVASTTPSTTIYMYYGNSGASDAASSTAVWDANFAVVHHMVGATSTDLDDSTVNDNDMTAQYGTPVYNSDGKIGKGLYVNGAGTPEGVSFPDTASVSFSTAFTFEFWLKGNNWDSPQDQAVMGKGTTGGGKLTYHFGAWADDFGALWSYNGTSWQVGRGIGGHTDNVWYHMAVTWNGSNWYSYNNGEQVSTVANSGTIIDTDVAVFFGKSTGVEYFNGTIDEARFSNILRSAAWIKASYNSGNDTLLTYGGEESETVAAIAPQMEVIIIGG